MFLFCRASGLCHKFSIKQNFWIFPCKCLKVFNISAIIIGSPWSPWQQKKPSTWRRWRSLKSSWTFSTLGSCISACWRLRRRAASSTGCTQMTCSSSGRRIGCQTCKLDAFDLDYCSRWWWTRAAFVSGNWCWMASGMRFCSSFSRWSSWINLTEGGVFGVS